MAKFRIITLGCKVNQSESESVAQGLIDKGWEVSNGDDSVDVWVVNTCAVTAKAAMQSRGEVRRAVRSGGRVVVTGCYAQTDPGEIERIDGVERILGTADKDKQIELISSALHDGQERVIHRDIREETCFPLTPLAVSGGKTRAFLKIQDGCDSFCTYCIVPYARGRSRSMPVFEVLKRISALQKRGYREIVLAGVHLGRYGMDFDPPVSFVELLQRIKQRCDSVLIRLSSLEPNEINDDMIALVSSSDGFCRHFHIPLQSGDDGVLKNMGRPYTSGLFVSQVQKIHERIPDAAIGADVLVGFPGESDSRFQNTCSLIESLPLTYLHVFPFSPRKGTPAEKMSGKISEPVINQRCKMLRKIGSEKKRTFYNRYIGKETNALIIGSSGSSHKPSKGLTSNYIPLKIFGNTETNTIAKVRIESVDPGLTVFARPVETPTRKTEIGI